jgi:hypothetical protein
VVERGIAKKAPFIGTKNSTADAMLIELYATAVRTTNPETDSELCFITSNHRDFSAPDDHRKPHPDIAEFFTSSTAGTLGAAVTSSAVVGWHCGVLGGLEQKPYGGHHDVHEVLALLGFATLTGSGSTAIRMTFLGITQIFSGVASALTRPVSDRLREQPDHRRRRRIRARCPRHAASGSTTRVDSALGHRITTRAQSAFSGLVFVTPRREMGVDLSSTGALPAGRGSSRTRVFVLGCCGRADSDIRAIMDPVGVLTGFSQLGVDPVVWH